MELEILGLKGRKREEAMKAYRKLLSSSTDKPGARAGISYTPPIDHIYIHLKTYFQDFQNGVQKYYDILKSGDPDALQKFRNATL